MRPGDVVSYQDMCVIEGQSLQRGMNFRSRGHRTVILMSVRRGAPYRDRFEDEGRVIIYEGHDVPRSESRDPKRRDQPEKTSRGALTQNGRFLRSAKEAQAGGTAELVRVYEKIKDGIWVFNGVFALTDAWNEHDEHRVVFKFRLELQDSFTEDEDRRHKTDLEHSRVIPSAVKLEVWRRDKGRCQICGSVDNLHYDHDLPYSKGGTSLSATNIRLLCRRHNLEKRDRIE